MDDNDRLVRAAKNQSLFREVNERLQALADTFEWISETASFTCECADTSCVEQMQLTASEYEEVRSKPNRFAVLPGHVYSDVEQTVYENPRYAIVEKIGAAAKVAQAHDPRSAE